MRDPKLALMLALAAGACDSYGEGDATDGSADTDEGGGGTFTDADGDGVSEEPVAGSLCTESYSIPGPFGTVLDSAVETHAEVFDDAEQELSPGYPERGVVGALPSHLHLGWPGEDTSRSVSFVWTTNLGTRSSLVQIAEGEDLDPQAFTTSLEGVTYRYGGSTGDAYRIHELKLCGRLKPATTYSYRVGGEGHWSEVHSFTTPGAPGTFDSFVAVLMGDSRGSYEEWRRLVEQMEAESPDVYLFSGDAVELGSNQFEWHAWWEASGDVFARRFLAPAHGNHEALASNYFAQFSLPGTEEYYTLRYGPLALASLNDTSALGEQSYQFDQVTFMNENLDRDADWQMVMHHRPTYSACSRHGSDEILRGYWEPTFESLGVDFVLSGHNHIYERSIALRAGEERNLGEGTLYLVSGGAGAELYQEFGDEWFNAVADPIEHFIVAEFGGEGVQMTVKAIDTGNVIDEFFVPKPE